MEYGKIALLTGIVILLLWMLIRTICAKHTKTIIVSSVLSGLLALATVCMIGQLQSPTLHINPYTLCVSSVLGIPGVVLMLAIQLLWTL